MTSPVTTSDLASCYADATRKNGLIELVTAIHPELGYLQLKRQDLVSYFSSSLWVQTGQSTGHRKLKHKVTRVIVEYQNHGDQVIADHIQKQIFRQTQGHLNILCNDIFKYTVNNWQEEPDYNQALRNYRNLQIEARPLSTSEP